MRGELWILGLVGGLRRLGGLGQVRELWILNCEFWIGDKLQACASGGDKGNAIKSYEVTSKTANKVPQITKENTIRANGGTFVKDKNGNLVDISNVPTQIIRIR